MHPLSASLLAARDAEDTASTRFAALDRAATAIESAAAALALAEAGSEEERAIFGAALERVVAGGRLVLWGVL